MAALASSGSEVRAAFTKPKRNVHVNRGCSKERNVHVNRDCSKERNVHVKRGCSKERNVHVNRGCSKECKKSWVAPDIVWISMLDRFGTSWWGRYVYSSTPSCSVQECGLHHHYWSPYMYSWASEDLSKLDDIQIHLKTNQTKKYFQYKTYYD